MKTFFHFIRFSAAITLFVILFVFGWQNQHLVAAIGCIAFLLAFAIICVGLAAFAIVGIGKILWHLTK
jgi:hypothetical protein